MKWLIALAGLGSALLLGGALAFQYVGGLAPCPMCIWQRWPHAAAVAIAVVALLGPAAAARGLAAVGALAALTTAGIGVFHAGVEQGWWEGPTTCTSGSIEGMSTDDLLGQIMNAPLVRCDEIVWEFLGISMAGWNALLSLLLAGVWIAALRARPAPQLSSSASQ